MSLNFKTAIVRICFGCLVTGVIVLGAAVDSIAQSDGIGRLLNKADVVAPKTDEVTAALSTGQQTSPDDEVLPAASLLPSDHFARLNAKPSNFRRAGFVARQQADLEGAVLPMTVSPTINQNRPSEGMDGRLLRSSGNRFNPRSLPQEYVFDGSDRASRTHVDQDFNVYGLDTEDTVAHFDTSDGDRIVTPSNRVAIYAPRFGAVRRVDGVVNAQYNQPTIAFDERQQTVQAVDQSRATMSRQFSMSKRTHSTSRASGFIDQTRGVTADSALLLRGTRNYLQALHGHSVLEIDRLDLAVGAQLQHGIQSAVAWETDLGLRVVSNGLQPIIVRDLKTAQELKHIESEDGQPTLRVVKIADKIAARPGEEVEFTIRFDNISARPIGNVTLMDNLTRRLEYIDGSSECSKNSEFKSELNEAESLVLRWEVTDPLEPGTGGVIRFRCRVR